MGPCLSLPTRCCHISIFLDTQDGQSWGGTVLLIEPGTGSPGTAPCAGRGDAVALASRLPPPSLPCSILALPALPVPPAVPFAPGPPAHRALLAPALHGDMGASPQWVASVNRVPIRGICPQALGKCPLPALGAAGRAPRSLHPHPRPPPVAEGAEPWGGCPLGHERDPDPGRELMEGKGSGKPAPLPARARVRRRAPG